MNRLQEAIARSEANKPVIEQLFSTSLFAQIRNNSKYASQRPEVPFPVHFTLSNDGYCVQGNCNQYRLQDVLLYAKVDGRLIPLTNFRKYEDE